MRQELERDADHWDLAAVFASALSLWQQLTKQAKADPQLNLSDSYHGIDGLMRQLMRIAIQFEIWASLHISFEKLDEVWPYMLEERFGPACLRILLPSALAQFGETHCLRVALQLKLPVKLIDDLQVPIDVHAANPISGSGFREFRIQTMRICFEGNEAVPYVLTDEPFDENFDRPFFSIFGIGEDKLLEHIADRRTYREAVGLVQKLAPGIVFPEVPTS